MEKCNCSCCSRLKFFAGLAVLGLLAAGVCCCLCSDRKKNFADCTLVDDAKDHVKQMKQEAKEAFQDVGEFCQEAGRMGKDLKKDTMDAVQKQMDHTNQS